MIKGKNDEAAVREGCYFDESHAERVRLFFYKYLRHSKGTQFAGKPFELLEWQWNDLVRPLFGWRRKNGLRRYRRAYVEIPKKNGKSTLCAGISIYLTCGDGEPGAEVYSAAGDRKQASIVFNEAANMVEASPALRSRLQISRSQKFIRYARNHSEYFALSADAPTKEGLNIHGLIFDELHTQPNRKLWDTLYYGGASRLQPLMITITTAGDDVTSLCWEEHCYAERLLDEKDETIDWEYFAYIRAADEKDDYLDPAVWKKANPSFGITINEDDFRAEAIRASQNPSLLNSFLRYRLNIWTSGSTRWLTPLQWSACDHPEEPQPRHGEDCYLGIDLSSITDLVAVARFFPNPPRVLLDYWAPNAIVQERKQSKRMRYDYWVDRGLISLVAGARIEYNLIEKRVADLHDQYNVVEVGIDPWNAIQFAQNLQSQGFNVSFIRQGYASLSPAMKELERLVLGRELRHYADPVLAWMVGNVQVETDVNKNIRPHKRNSKDSIDGVAAVLMAIHCWIKNAKPQSIYAKRGLITS